MTKYLKTKPGSIEELVGKMNNVQDNSEYQKMFKKELDKAGKGIGSMTPAEKKAFFNKIDSKYTAKNEDLNTKDEPSVKDVANQLKKAVKAHGQQAKDLEKAIKSEAKVDELTAAQKKLPPALQKAIKDKEDKKEIKEELQVLNNGYKVVPETYNSKKEADFRAEAETKLTGDQYESYQSPKRPDSFHVRKVESGIKLEESASSDTDEKNDKKIDAQKKGEKKVVDPMPKMTQEAASNQNLYQKIYDIWTEAATEKTKKDEEKGKKTDVGTTPSTVDTKPSVDYEK